MPDPCLGCCGSWCGPCVATLVKPPYDAFIKHAGYLFNAGRNMRGLEKATKGLANEIKGMERMIRDDKDRKGFIATAEAIACVKEAKETETRAKKIQVRYGRRYTVLGCCSPNFWLKYRVSKEAVEMLPECDIKKPETVTVEPPPLPVVHIPDQVVLLPSQELILKDALQCIANDDEVGPIGIWGPRGAGKTLLLNKINNSFERRRNSPGPSADTQTPAVNHSASSENEITEVAATTTAAAASEPEPELEPDRGDSPFDFVIYVTASGDCTVKNIQSEIMQRLKMQGGGSVTDHAKRISEFLVGRSFLVLLDDLHGALNLAAVGIPYPLGTQGKIKRKVVIATKSQVLCDQMGVNRAIIVPCLEKSEALQLFQENVGEDGLYSDPNFGALAKDIAEELKGRPLDLIHIGLSMRGRRDPNDWQVTSRLVKELVSENGDALPMVEQMVRKLRKGVADLRGRSDDVRHKIEVAKGNGREPTNQITIWLDRVGTVIHDVMVVRESMQHGLNWDLTATAVDRLRELQECLQDQPSDILAKALPPPVEELPVPFEVDLPSRQVFLQQVVHYIKDNESQVIGMWGQGGAGKTHLLKRTNNSFCGDTDTTYNFVIYLTASTNCSVQNIQSQILKRLNMQDGDSVTTQANSIFQFLKDKSFAILIDDLWDFVDLTAVGVPHPLGTQGKLQRKVVVATRSQTLCNQMHANIAMQVPSLQENEALLLFKQNVGEDNLYSDPQIGDLAKHLVEELKALPLELIRIGKAMRGKVDRRQWEEVISVAKDWIRLTDTTLSSTEKVVKKIEESMKILCGMSSDIRYKIELAKRKDMEATNKVKIWLDRADTIISEGKAICEAKQIEWNTNLHKIAESKLDELQKFINHPPPSDSDIAVEAPPTRVTDLGLPMCSEGPNQVLEDALKLIKDDPAGMIGICGTGGVGKTHLLKKINQSFVEDHFFDVVIYVTVSEYSKQKIQDQILQQLKLLPKSEDLQSRAVSIRKNLKEEKSFLILLDDLWNELDLQEVGIPLPLGISSTFKRKVVITTRSPDVCRKMDVTEQIKLAPLHENEACQLFEKTVGQPGLFSNPAYGKLAKDLVKQLGGLPLTLVTTGKSMRGRHDPRHWESIVDYMRKSGNYNGAGAAKHMDKDYVKLKYSYDSLPTQIMKDCFLTCSLWPEGWEIPIDELAKCWMGLGLVDESNIKSCYNKVYIIVSDLEDASLLQNDTGITVKMHSLIRGMAIWISRDHGKHKKVVVDAGGANTGRFMDAGVMQDFIIQFQPNILREPTPLNGALSRNFSWSDAEYVSLMLNKMQQIPRVSPNNCPRNVKALFLQHNDLDESIAGTIEHFTLLTYLDLSWNKLKIIPEKLCNLVNLKFLNLSHNAELHKVPRSFRNLTRLRFLYLGGTNIRKMPKGVISQMKDLNVLDLKYRYIPGAPSPVYWVPSVCPELDGLANLIQLDVVVDGNLQYELLSRTPNLPLRQVTLQQLHQPDALFCLSGGIFSDNMVGKTLRDLEIVNSDMKTITIQRAEGTPNYCFEALETLKLDYLYYLKKIVWELRTEDVFPRLTVLDVTFCDHLEDISCAMYLPSLRLLDISFCDNIRQAFSNKKKMSLIQTFPCLQELRFAYLANLASISGSDVTFPSLETLSFVGCLELQRLPFKMESFPQKLRELKFDHNFDQVTKQCWDYEELKWEEEGVKDLLRPYLKIKDQNQAEDEDEDEELKAFNRMLRFLFPFFPVDSMYRGGRCPCYYLNGRKQPAPRRSSSTESSSHGCRS